MWTDSPRLDSGACGYSVAWRHSPNDWRGVKTYNQEAYDAECTTLVRALDLAADRQQQKDSSGSRFHGRSSSYYAYAGRHAKSALASSTSYKLARPWKVSSVWLRYGGVQPTQASRGMKSRTDGRNSRQKCPTATSSSGSDTATTNGGACPYQHPSPTRSDALTIKKVEGGPRVVPRPHKEPQLQCPALRD